MNLLLSTILNFSLMDYMKLYYMKTHTRAAPWFIGLLMGFILARMKFNGEYKIRKLNTVRTFFEQDLIERFQHLFQCLQL